MRLTRIEIRNFRSIRNLAVDLGDTTAFIGPNNAGKTAILDAVRLGLTRRWGERGTRFSGSDVRDASDGTDAGGACIAIRAEESSPGEWPSDIAETGSTESKGEPRSLEFRIRFSQHEKSSQHEQRMRFMDTDGEPASEWLMVEESAGQLWRLFPVFYLGVPRSLDGIALPLPRFWEKYLQALEIPVGLESAAEDVLAELYSAMKKGETSAKRIMEAIVQRSPLEFERGRVPDPTLIPSEIFDDFDWVQWIIDSQQEDRLYSFDEQGQATQSLVVMNLAQSFVKYLHRAKYTRTSRPVFVIEEPEAHLSPQAARLLWRHVQALPGQKIVTTHSPYFVQHMPFRGLRLVRHNENETEVGSLPASFSTEIPGFDGLDEEVQHSDGLLRFERDKEILTVNGILPERTYRKLLARCGSDARRADFVRRTG